MYPRFDKFRIAESPSLWASNSGIDYCPNLWLLLIYYSWFLEDLPVFLFYAWPE